MGITNRFILKQLIDFRNGHLVSFLYRSIDFRRYTARQEVGVFVFGQFPGVISRWIPNFRDQSAAFFGKRIRPIGINEDGCSYADRKWSRGPQIRIFGGGDSAGW